MLPPDRSLSRRSFLAGTAGIALAGCLDLSSSTPDTFDSYGPALAAVTEQGVEWDDLGELEGTLEIYSGRDRTQIQPLFDRLEAVYPDFTANVRYGTSAGLVGQIDAEGENSPADVFYTQDAATLGALKARNRTRELPKDVLELVDPIRRDPEGTWTGVSGRVRSVLYHSDTWDADSLPDDIFAYATDDRFTGELAFRPTSGSFQAFATAMRIVHGDEETRSFFETLVEERDAVYYEGGSQITDAVARGHVTVALENQYYVSRYRSDNPDAAVDVTYTTDDVGCLFNVSGCAIVDSSERPNLAAEFLRHVLAEEGQEFFIETNGEYPVRSDVPYVDFLTPLDEIQPPEFDLNELADLEGTIDVLREAGVDI